MTKLSRSYWQYMIWYCAGAFIKVDTVEVMSGKACVGYAVNKTILHCTPQMQQVMYSHYAENQRVSSLLWYKWDCRMIRGQPSAAFQNDTD